jgi:DNA-binding GntR family transcriptional regulator
MATANRPTSNVLTAADRAFHGKSAQMSGNTVPIDFARSLHERSVRYRYMHLWQAIDARAPIRQHMRLPI